MPRLVVGLVLVAFPVVFAGLWISVTWLTAALGGWRVLAAAYADPTPWAGQALPNRNGWMGLWGYGWSLTMGADHHSLHLSVMAPFRVGHPSLRIPLDEITVTEEPGILGPRALYRFRRAPRVRFRTPMATAWELAELSGGRLAPVAPSTLTASGPTTPPTTTVPPGTRPPPSR